MIDFKKKLEETEKTDKRYQEDFSDIEATLGNKKRKRIVTYIIAILVVAAIFAGRILISSQSGSGWFSGGFFGTIKHLVTGADRQMKGEDVDRVNILLLGMGGEGHDGPYLTDTMMILSIKPSTGQVALLSLPRDLVAPQSGWLKINSINAYAEQKAPGSGGEATSQAMSDLLQIPIDYYVRVDFNGFVNVINQLGGVTVNVENTLDDYSYPIGGQENNPNYYARFEHLHIDKGLQTMDGALALKYIRSRHALGVEGSDFARSRRQQLLMEAVKGKLLSRQTLLNPVTVGKLIAELNKDVATNLSVWEMIRLWNLTKNVSHDQIISKVLSDAPDGLLVAGVGEEGAYILTPRSGNFSEIRSLAQNIFNLTTPPTAAETKALTRRSSLIILNGTFITGLANKTADNLMANRFVIAKVGNATERNRLDSVIYDLSGGQKNQDLALLEKITSAQLATDTPDLTPYLSDASGTSFVLILGTSANRAEY